MRLPIQTKPAIRGIPHSPARVGITASESCVLCLAKCRSIGGSFQAVCDELCRTMGCTD